MAHHLSKLLELPKLFTKELIELIYPSFCPTCNKTSVKHSICSDCREAFIKIEGPLCSICGRTFQSKVAKDHRCGRCIKDPPFFDKAGSVYSFEGLLKEGLHLFKYSGKTCLAGPLAKELSGHPIADDDYDMIIPVPLYIKRLRGRGFNQSHLLAKKLGNVKDIPVDSFIIERKRETDSQTGMKRNKREENVRGAFRLRPHVDVKGASILIVDDVYTTGATSRECSKVLKKGGAMNVNVLTLARVCDFS